MNLYLGTLAPVLTGTTLAHDERAIISELGAAGLPLVLSHWQDSPQLMTMADNMMRDLLHSGGTAPEGVDGDAPNRLLMYLVNKDRPYSEIITADYCVNEDFRETPCDAKAPFQAGVLTSRVFLQRHASRFNLRRATVLMEAFLCVNHNEGLFGKQDRAPQEAMIDLYAGERDPTSALLFSGADCHACHGLFAPHTQLFVKFGADGTYNEAFHGAQAADLPPGLSDHGESYASHFRDPSEASSESVSFFGHEVRNLREAALVMAHMNEFYECAVSNVLAYSLGLEFRSKQLAPTLVADIARKLRSNPSSLRSWKKRGLSGPGFRDIVYEVFIHPEVQRGVTSVTKATP